MVLIQRCPLRVVSQYVRLPEPHSVHYEDDQEDKAKAESCKESFLSSEPSRLFQLPIITEGIEIHVGTAKSYTSSHYLVEIM